MKSVIKTQSGKNIQIPYAYVEKSGLAENPNLDVHVLEQALVFLPERMTAFEAIKAMASLMRVSSDLFSRLACECNPCEDCYTNGRCEYKLMALRSAVDIPPEFRKILGLSDNMEIRVKFDEQSKSIDFVVTEKDDEPCLANVPVWLQGLFESFGICLGDLDELIQSEDIVYGE